MNIDSKELTHIPMFGSLQAADIERLGNIIEVLSFKENEPIFSEGDAADGLYILIRGKAEVWKNYANGEDHEVLASLEPYAIFGEMTLLTEEQTRRSAEVRALTNSTVIKMKKESFHQLILKNDPLSVAILAEIVRILSERLRRLTNEMMRLMDVPPDQMPKKLADLSRFKDKIFSEWSF